MEVFGENIRNARKYRALSQKQLSVKSRISRSSISMIENNKIDIYFKTAKRLAESLNISLPQFFSRNFINEEITTYIEDDFLLIFSQNVEDLLKKKNKYQTYLYASTTLSPSTINEILNQKVNPKLSSLNQIADALEATLCELITRKGEYK
ncbi:MULTISPECIES: helix-turn-helix domain-containing protein [Bacillus]|uniref:helix-turn-helix domain-containing protein n=1 Tax=Bacillus TaxID=1386 RepID=UPI00115CE236|nr:MULTISPECIES: helix-turn-helix domain-containing protein [Bacillus]MDR6749015.1 transcriptional regulator with XRE-family HTH domain [Bacillus pumilus]MED1533525.1 helix-turn-helix domain-containing protein [Bacillus altitudinis]TQR23501.1 helix-turn-helix domain-containing protein [Bacillus sp. SDF0016]